jgi:AraC family transcriptional regulator
MTNSNTTVPAYRRRVLASAPGLRVVLTWYARHHAMDAHEHDVAQHSFLLAGAMEEVSRGRSHVVDSPGAGVKPAGCSHANRYGRNGALILCVEADDATGRTVGLAADDWSWRHDRVSPAGLARIVRNSECAAEMAGELAAAAAPAVRQYTTPPAWLTEIRERLREAPDETELDVEASRAGVHRVHLTRAFTRHFGMTPSLFRQRARLARATALLAEGRCGTEAAHAAGFADQSHLIRIMRRETGFTPGQLSQALAG